MLFQIKKRGLAFIHLQWRKGKRLFSKTRLSREESFHVPIVLNNRNWYTYIKELVDWLQNAGYKNIYILDNNSDYPDLLDYYKVTTAKVIYLGENKGYKALWQTDLFRQLRRGYYVYSDADLLPVKECPADVVYRLYHVLSRYNIEKCGPALRIDDLPEHYARKEEVIKIETKHWEQVVEEQVYDAPVDTTFALYKPFAEGDAEQAKAYRVGGNLTFIHRPWYENSENPEKEAVYYKKHATASSFWYTKK